MRGDVGKFEPGVLQKEKGPRLKKRIENLVLRS